MAKVKITSNGNPSSTRVEIDGIDISECIGRLTLDVSANDRSISLLLHIPVEILEIGGEIPTIINKYCENNSAP